MQNPDIHKTQTEQNIRTHIERHMHVHARVHTYTHNLPTMELTPKPHTLT